MHLPGTLQALPITLQGIYIEKVNAALHLNSSYAKPFSIMNLGGYRLRQANSTLLRNGKRSMY